MATKPFRWGEPSTIRWDPDLKKFFIEEKRSYVFWNPDLVGANQTSNLVDVQPKYGESAMTSEAINGGPPKPKLEWRVERISDEASRVHRFRIGLHVDGLLFATADVDRPAAGELSARQSRKLERKIEEAKAGIMRTYLLTVRHSGPANRTV